MNKTEQTRFAIQYSTDFGIVRDLATSIIDVCEKKNREYGESFRLRGGQGAYFAYVRKPDRLEAQMKSRDYDVFNVDQDPCSTESIDETIRDEIGYLLLILETREAIRRFMSSKEAK